MLFKFTSHKSVTHDQILKLTINVLTPYGPVPFLIFTATPPPTHWPWPLALSQVAAVEIYPYEMGQLYNSFYWKLKNICKMRR